MSLAYYNENDPFAAAWLIELIADGLIAPGIVDQRSILDVIPSDLKGYTQCHFFAGIGVWSLALRLAGWPDDRPIWTGSCPCQPFSNAGKGDGFDDERHLWPAWFHLVANGKRRDVPIVGEQVASKDGRTWFDLVSSDMQGLDHACGAVDTSAASLGAPFIGQRLYWLGATRSARFQGRRNQPRQSYDAQRWGIADDAGAISGVGDGLAAPESERWPEGVTHSGGVREGNSEKGQVGRSTVDSNSFSSRLVAPHSGECEQQSGERRSDGIFGKTSSTTEEQQRSGDHSTSNNCSPNQRPKYSDGTPLHPTEYWRNADWLLCRDPNRARFRPVEPGTFPLVDARTIRNRVAAVRGAGNALNISQAACFIEAMMSYLDQ